MFVEGSVEQDLGPSSPTRHIDIVIRVIFDIPLPKQMWYLRQSKESWNQAETALEIWNFFTSFTRKTEASEQYEKKDMAI